jgi:hypothetical protein
MANVDEVLITKISKGKNNKFNQLRLLRISEAVSFISGTKEVPCKTVISVMGNNKEASFFKPGKEAFRGSPNINDMYPYIGDINIEKNEVGGYKFDDIWEYLLKISIINQLTFQKVLIIIYRICYFYDHKLNNNKQLRYSPDSELLDYIYKLDFSLKDGFIDKFKNEEIGFIEFLHFIDLLGWNEDVKYNTNGTEPFIGNNKRTGRVNTILSVISVPLMVNDFLANIISNVNYVERINVKLILSTMQKLSKSRGICVLTNKDLKRYLSPFLID